MIDLSPYLRAIDDAMRSAVHSDNPVLKNFYDTMAYPLGWADENFQPAHADSGKRVRPILCLLVCETIAGEFTPALPAAAAIEILHNFSLIHDDIEDRDELRRHRPTLWKLVGVPQAINVGDALFAIAQNALLRLSERGVSAERVLRAESIFQQACVQLVEGQFLDMQGEQLADTNLAYYKQMIGGKTAALLGAATALGAAVATDDLATVRRYREFGVELGMAFQMSDDSLSVWGDPALTGKPAGSDLLRKKKSLPIILAQAHGGELSAAIQQSFAKDKLNEADVVAITHLMDEAGIRAQAAQEAEKHRHRATRNLKRATMEGVASTDAAQTLADLAESMTGRTF